MHLRCIHVNHPFAGERACAESTRYVYPNCRETAWQPHPCRQLQELIQPLDQVDQEERHGIRKSLAKTVGFKGTSIMHRLNSLYGFDLTKDFVIDLQHGLPLNPVKHEFEALLTHLERTDSSDSESHLEADNTNLIQVIDDQLQCFPWTSGMHT